ncbi:hypothetical protein [Alicyclobacillus sp. SO9]|uniref:hypothetical protein n=1 Tax=Alicyclobacillus sp. SO9 TaxID=2665646 RepID=UPI0018E76148|nr:hypothetical protein [Alicyclobacillus sp. SO9]QQE78288.1 hypothetical protein GI364_20790 [Alicyclobacillus sp. SO9]
MERFPRILPRLTIPKIITALVAIGLGVNGMIQLHLQKDMKTKTVELQQQVQSAKQLSGKMNHGLTGLSSIKASTLAMEGTLQNLGSVSDQMDTGLKQLSSTISGLNQSIQHISSSTGAANQSAQQIEQNLQPLVGLLSSMKTTNQGMENNLASMITDEQAINQDLAQMDKKTSILP